MADLIFFMHDDGANGAAGDAWGAYIENLRARGHFEGGSEIGDGVCVNKTGAAREIARHIGSFIRVHAADLAQARTLLAGNPAFEAGGTVEIRELPRTG